LIRNVKNFIRNSPQSLLARNSGWMFMGFGLRVVAQTGYFVLLARALGPREYGEFVAITALISIVAPFAGMGAGNLLIKNVARDRTVFAEAWGNALTVLAASGGLLLVAILLIVRFVLPDSIPWSLIVLVSVSDLIIVRVGELASQGFQATEQMRYTAKLYLLPYLLRLLCAAIVFSVWHRTTALRWGWFYLASTTIASAISVVLANRMLGAPKLGFYRIPGELEEGFYFATALSAQTVYNDIDKTMLARLSTLDATGIFAVAYRVIDVAFAPVRSVIYAAYPDFFRHGHKGIATSYAYAKRLLPRMMGYSVVVAVALFAAAPIIPVLLGSEYARTVEALRWLALLPLFKSMHYFLADSLTGAGYQRIRTITQIAVAGLNIGLNFWLIPAYSWRGAAWASVASDGTLVLAMYGVVMFGMAKESRLAVGFSGGGTQES
jgi:O-antigen/teichoic acid export membrane protein